MEGKQKVRRKDERPSEIVSCAMKLFVEKGFYETSFLDIAKEGNMARTTIYLYFKDKKELLKAALKAKFEENRGFIMNSFSAEKDSFDSRMVKILERMQLIAEDPFFRRFLVMISNVATKDPEIAQIWKAEIFDNLHTIWNAMCEEFKVKDLYRNYLFSVLYSVFFMSCFSAVCFKDSKTFVDFKDFAEITKQEILQGKFQWMLSHE